MVVVARWAAGRPSRGSKSRCQNALPVASFGAQQLENDLGSDMEAIEASSHLTSEGEADAGWVRVVR